MKKLILVAMLLTISACGMNRPFTPTISYINGNNAALAYGNQTGYVAVGDLSEAQLNWDVSNVPGASGVRIIAARDYNCATEVASASLNIVNSALNSGYVGGGAYTGVGINPNENLRTVFQSNIAAITAGTYYICVRAIKMGQEGPPSFPVTINVRNNQAQYMTAGGSSTEPTANTLDPENDPYYDARITTEIKKEQIDEQIAE